MIHPQISLSTQQQMQIHHSDETVYSLSAEQPVLLVFLRHFGCVFCKEALHSLSRIKDDITERNLKLVFVHMSTPDTAETYFAQHGLEGVAQISDPECRYYKAFGLGKGTFSQLYGLSTWIRGYKATRKGHQLEIDKALGDTTQMPGMFLLFEGEVKNSYIHKFASSAPDYQDMINCPSCYTTI